MLSAMRTPTRRTSQTVLALDASEQLVKMTPELIIADAVRR